MPTTTRAGRGQRGDVGRIAGRAAKFMAEKPCAVRDLLRRRLRQHRGALGLPIVSGIGHELCHRGTHACTVEGIDDVFGFGALRGRIRRQFQQRSLVGDESVHPRRMLRHQCQPGHRAAGRPEHVGGLCAQRVENRRGVVGTQLRGGILLGVIQHAVGDAARIGGDDGVIGCQSLRQRREVGGRHRRAEQQH